MWTMPIKNRLDMLATGIKTPVGIKVFGPDLDTLDVIGRQIEAAAAGGAGHELACSPSAPSAAATWT